MEFELQLKLQRCTQRTGNAARVLRRVARKKLGTRVEVAAPKTVFNLPKRTGKHVKSSADDIAKPHMLLKMKNNVR